MKQNRDGGFFQSSVSKIIKYSKDETFENEKKTCQINYISVMQKHFSGKKQVYF